MNSDRSKQSWPWLAQLACMKPSHVRGWASMNLRAFFDVRFVCLHESAKSQVFDGSSCTSVAGPNRTMQTHMIQMLVHRIGEASAVCALNLKAGSSPTQNVILYAGRLGAGYPNCHVCSIRCTKIFLMYRSTIAGHAGTVFCRRLFGVSSANPSTLHARLHDLHEAALTSIFASEMRPSMRPARTSQEPDQCITSREAAASPFSKPSPLSGCGRGRSLRHAPTLLLSHLTMESCLQ